MAKNKNISPKYISLGKLFFFEKRLVIGVVPCRKGKLKENKITVFKEKGKGLLYMFTVT